DGEGGEDGVGDSMIIQVKYTIDSKYVATDCNYLLFSENSAVLRINVQPPASVPTPITARPVHTGKTIYTGKTTVWRYAQTIPSLGGLDHTKTNSYQTIPITGMRR
ncbi:MAG: hypothetical protein MMC33_006867, partial [Icmadophila ericetorum]|nr:hypothetical protein [Icmadophila ericetorum]